MGALVYRSERYPFDDRTVAHLRAAITNKLRRKEGFLLSWTVAAVDGGGRVSLWISTATPLQFVFENESIELNTRWLEALARSSHGPRGMVIIPESAAEGIAAGAPGDRGVQERIQAALNEVTAQLPAARP
ncbi:hypothetical protein [Planctomonas sp. JC2975]|uniref:DUF7882 family protein n=1 Tax=Planctomonas sp. JC2975 TaxID=2729626 RepID=UPI00197C8D1A|nr:hypothetical protein [Planctomonas sp. JC2975]